MNIVVQFCRIFVGILFIFSGLIKLNDPIGFSIKLDEYFSAAVLGLEFLQPFALPLAVFLVVFEVVLGVMLLLGFQRAFTLWSLALMIVFFTFLTFYSAYFEKVTDCGCFGDAIPLNPWQSFYKDVVLLVMIGILVKFNAFIKPAFAKAYSIIIILVVTMGSFGLAYYVLMHLPILDFRAYKVGTNVVKAMEEDPTRPDVYGYDWYYTVDGKENVITTNGQQPQGYGNPDKVETRLLKKGYEPPIHDFTIEQNGQDITQQVITANKVVLVVMYNLDRAERDGLYELKDFVKSAQSKGYEVLALSASPQEKADLMMENYGFKIPFAITDETVLKTMIRANPGVLILKNKIITAKSHWSDLDNLQL